MDIIKEIFKETGRKFLMTAFLILLFSIFVIVGKMTVDQFIIVIPIIAGTYIAGNVAQKFTK